MWGCSGVFSCVRVCVCECACLTVSVELFLMCVCVCLCVCPCVWSCVCVCFNVCLYTWVYMFASPSSSRPPSFPFSERTHKSAVGGQYVGQSHTHTHSHILTQTHTLSLIPHFSSLSTTLLPSTGCTHEGLGGGQCVGQLCTLRPAMDQDTRERCGRSE